MASEDMQVDLVGAGRCRRAMDWFRTRLGAIVLATLVVLGALAVVFAWSVASPSGASPDDDFHQTSIWCPDGVQSCPAQTTAAGTTLVEVPAKVADASVCFAFNSDQSGECVNEITRTTDWTSRFNDGQYPGGFYAVMHLLVGPNVYGSLVLMRIVNGVVAVVLLGMLAWCLPRSGRRLMAYATLTVCIPLLIYTVCSVNPSSWAVTGVVVAWFGMYASLVGQSRLKIILPGLIALIGAGMAAMARTDAGAYLVLVAVATVILHTPQIWKKPWKLILPGVVSVLGVIGFFSAGQTGAALSGMTSGARAGGWHLLAYNLVSLPRFLIDYTAGWIGLNWVDTPMPPIVWVPVAGISLALVFIGLHRLDWRKTLAFGGTLAAYIVLPLLLLQLSDSLVGANVQPRYMAPLVPLVVAMALWRPKVGGAPRLSRAQTVVVYVLLVAAQAAALHTQIRRFTVGLDVLALNLNAQIEWWHAGPLPMQTWAIGSAGFALLALVLFSVRREDPDELTELALDQTIPKRSKRQPARNELTACAS